jgi:hypothetical protein
MANSSLYTHRKLKYIIQTSSDSYVNAKNLWGQTLKKDLIVGRQAAGDDG